MKQKPYNYLQMSAEDRAMWDYQNAGEEFASEGPAVYKAGDDLYLEQLSTYDQLGPSSMGDIATDPRYKDYEMEALRQLEDQSKNGFTARDQADMVRVEQQANRANRGRQGAIQQNMQSRGLSGSGLDFAMQQQSAQDSAEMEALSGLEKNAQMSERKQSAAERLGSLGGQLQGRDFQQQAQKAQAADEIARFNTANSVQRQNANNDIANQQRAQNWGRTNQTNDRNTQSAYDYRGDKLGVQQGNATMAYNKAQDDYNKAQLRKQQRDAKRRGQNAMIGSVAGGVGGFVLGGPAGAAAGSQAGGALGGAFAHGGMVPGRAPFEDMDTPENDIFAAQLSPGEIVIPKSIAQDPVASAKFVAAQNAGMDPMASKYVAQTADQVQADKVALAKNAPFYPTPDGKPIPAPKAQSVGVRTKQTARPSVIPEPVLKQLEATRPDLVAEYRKKMSDADTSVADAEKMQGYMGMANLAGKAFTDYGNSQKTDVILANRMQELGRAPTVVAADRKEYDGSAIDRLAAQGVANAKDKRQGVKENFDDEQKLQGIEQANRLKDPNSEESKSAREFLKATLPAIANNPALANMSAAQLDKANPLLLEKWKADREDAYRSQQIGLEREKIKATGTNKLKLNEDERKNLNSGAMGLKAVRDMRAALSKGDNTFSLVGDNDFTAARTAFEEGLGRLQSGGAINNEEAERFRGMAPTKWDNAAMQQKKLNRIEAELAARIQAVGVDPEAAVAARGGSNSPAPHGNKVKQNGINYTWNGKEYVPEQA